MSSGKPHRTDGYCASSPRKQRGFAFMVVLLGVVLGAMTLYVQALSQNSSSVQRNDTTRVALAEAKQALIAWSAEYANNGPGHLPCPDTDGNGHGQGNACPSPHIGRFPWKTLNAPDLRDASGERLWYAISGNFLNRPENAVNSDTAGAYTISGNTDASRVIAIIFAPGAALAQQDRSSEEARNNYANYLEGANFKDDLYTSQPISESSNDQIAVVTTADLFPAVERTIADRVQQYIVPLLPYYLQSWIEANNEAGKNGAPARLLPFATPFDPATPTSCVANQCTQGRLPVEFVGQWEAVNWENQSGTCIEAPLNDRPVGSMSTLRCTVVISVPSDDDDDECDDDDEIVDRTVRFNVRLDEAGGKTFAMPLDKRRISHTSLAQPYAFEVHSARLSGGNIEFRYNGSYQLSTCSTKAQRTTVIELPVYRIDDQYFYDQNAKIDTEVDAMSGLSATQKDDLKKRRKDRIDPGWYFRNEWYHVTYYAVAPQRLPGDSACIAEPFTVENGTNSPTEHEALLILTGYGLHGIQRPSANLADYLEQKNVDTNSKVFQQTMQSRQFNDHIVPVTGLPTICP